MKTFFKIAVAVLLLFFLGLAIFFWTTERSDTHDLIDALNQPVPGHTVSAQTTEILEGMFFDEKLDTVPRLFLTNFPADFPQNGNPVLFAKVITALILRANERIQQERDILLILQNKMNRHKKWTSKETMFFNQMVQKYDCDLLRTPETQLSELLIKVDEIPVSLAVIQTGLQTDWGRENLNAPFGEKMWYDRSTYADKKFDTLIEGVDSYVRSLNATIPYFQWRMARKMVKPLKYNRRGNAFANFLQTYNPDDKQYTQKLMVFYLKTKLGTLDRAKFRSE